MDTQNVKSLLSKISNIVKKYEHQIALTGENFNIFELLGVQNEEIRTHSSIISDLLNPLGSHGQGSIFLDAFVNQFKIEAFDSQSAKCYKEKYIGKKTDKSGGRIDIFIEDKLENRIFIENKIYAEDQENQLLRYCNYDKKASVFYLTLYGNEPSEGSKQTLESSKHFVCLSYHTDIIEWLIKCRKEAATIPILRETITQYINLIKILTNQTIDSIMSKEITDVILKSDDSLEAYFQGLKNEAEVLDKILELLKDKLNERKSKIEKERNIELGFQFDLSRYKANTEFYFSIKFLKKHDIFICFQCEKKWINDFFFGLHKSLENSKLLLKHKKALTLAFEEEFVNEAGSNDELWIGWNWYEQRNWTFDTYLEIYKGEFIDDIENKLRTMLDIIQNVELQF